MAGSVEGVDSIILSVSKERNDEYDLVNKYKKMGCNVCYYHLDNKKENRAKSSVIHCSEAIPAGRSHEGYILLKT